MDAVMVVAIIAMYVIQVSLASKETLNYLQIGILMMGRAYLKIPFAIAMLQFIVKVKQIRTQQVAIHP